MIDPFIYVGEKMKTHIKLEEFLLSAAGSQPQDGFRSSTLGEVK